MERAYPLTDPQRDAIVARAHALVGCPYDYPAYVGFALEVLKLRDGQELDPVFKEDHWRVCSPWWRTATRTLGSTWKRACSTRT